MSTVFLLIIALPFLLAFPGFFLMRIFFASMDRIEKSTLSVLLSMIVVYMSLFAVEKTFGKLTSFNTALAVVMVNLICGTLFATVHWRQSRQS